uniref:E74-like factor 3 (ets domain transcription factor, epithelial-specific ) n=1 Tax=Sinocyclocheilus anshuiensis TaxID=1608454 RepID=A0A671QHQ9_9TELE
MFQVNVSRSEKLFSGKKQKGRVAVRARAREIFAGIPPPRRICSPGHAPSCLWDLVNPQMWTRQNVLEWIGFHVEDSRFDASLLNMNYCDMDGITLCTIYGEQQRRNLFEEAFEVSVLECINTLDLFVSTATDLSETCLSESELDLLDNILQNSFPYMHGPSLGPLLETVVVQPSIPSGEKQIPLSPRGTHLWEFIRDILIHPEKNQGLMKWEDRRDGVFKFLKSEAVAQLWGQKYYYKREILERVDGRRLVYKFGKNSTGWRMEETGY